jgi:hypothetical protein
MFFKKVAEEDRFFAVVAQIAGITASLAHDRNEAFSTTAFFTLVERRISEAGKKLSTEQKQTLFLLGAILERGVGGGAKGVLTQLGELLASDEGAPAFTSYVADSLIQQFRELVEPYGIVFRLSGDMERHLQQHRSSEREASQRRINKENNSTGNEQEEGRNCGDDKKLEGRMKAFGIERVGSKFKVKGFVFGSIEGALKFAGASTEKIDEVSGQS